MRAQTFGAHTLCDRCNSPEGLPPGSASRENSVRTHRGAEAFRVRGHTPTLKLTMSQTCLHYFHRLTRRLCGQLLVAMLCSTAAATACAAVDEAAAERLLRRSGMWNQSDAIAAAIAASFGEAHLQPGSTLSEQDGKRLGQLAGRVFTAAGLRAEALRTVAAALTPDDVKAAEAWYASALGRRITALEERATSEQADVAATKNKAAAVMSKASATRQQQVKALDEAVRASEQTASMVLNMALAVTYGVAKASNPVLTVDFKAIRSLLANQLAPVLAEVRTDTPKLFALTYAPLTDEELKAYIEFNRSPSAVKFNNAVIEGVDRAFVQLSLKLGEEYVRSIAQKRGT